METSSKSGLSPDITPKTVIMCTNMPNSLFDKENAKKHFGSFGQVKTILLRPKKQMCIVEYCTPVAAQRALLNAGAYDGFMFDVTWKKKKKTSPSVQKKEVTPTKQRKSKEDDPDWVPDSDVEEELTAMSNVPVYRQTRQQGSQQDQPMQSQAQTIVRRIPPVRPAVPPKSKERAPLPTSVWQASAAAEELPAVNIPTTLSTAEAATELNQLRTRVSRTADKQRRTLDARDRILRAWGGTGSRLKAGGATIGTCPDMCPEKERLQRQVEHQVNMLECDSSSGEGVMSEWRAVKQYSRSSADQETPMCYELRPASVLTMTMTYLMWEIADVTQNSQVSMADWFQFTWDRCRSIRKDITQQALCCADSVRLVEQCARFHAHCAARLADLEHSQFDQRLNTDNLTKCLQTLKHMYTDLPQESKPNEAEFRSYIALLNLGDANFVWEIKQLPKEIQKSDAITFAVQIFMALDNNNYVRFFRLIREKATYLQACILLRYFNDVRARGLARIVKAYAPRGGSKYPIQELIDNLGFEDVNSLHLFITHYGLHFSKHDEYDPSVILDRNQFIEDSDPYPIARAVNMIESKKNCTVGEVIAGGPLPSKDIYRDHKVYCSFNDDGTLKESALLADDLGYGTINESNNDLKSLKKALETTFYEVNSSEALKQTENKTVFVKQDPKQSFSTGKVKAFAAPKSENKQFSFKPAIPVVSSDLIKSSPENFFSRDSRAVFAFSKPDDNKGSSIWGENKSGNIFGSSKITTNTEFAKPDTVFGNLKNVQSDSKPFSETASKVSNIFSGAASQLFSSGTKTTSDMNNEKQSLFVSQTPVIGSTISGNLFANTSSSFAIATTATRSIFNTATTSADMSTTKGPINLFSSAKIDNTSTSETAKSIFGQTSGTLNQNPGDIFKTVSLPIFDQNKPSEIESANKHDPKILFGGLSNLSNKPHEHTSTPFSLPPSPKSLFSAALAQNVHSNKPQLGASIFGESKVLSATFGPILQQSNTQNITLEDEQLRQQQLQEQLIKQQREQQEKHHLAEAKRLEEQRNQEIKRFQEMKQEELRLQEEIKRKQEEKRQQEEQLKQEEQRKREESHRRIVEEQRQAEIKRAEEKRRAEEEKRKAEEKQRLLIQIHKESQELVDELVECISQESVEEFTVAELEDFKNLLNFANDLSNDLVQEVCDEICLSETKSEKFLTEKLMGKYGGIWIAYTARNITRRMMVQETPVWLTAVSPRESAELLRREVLPAALSKMKEFHEGRVFTGNIKPEPQLSLYNIMNIIKTSLLKGLKHVKINYHECFFWKFTISSPVCSQWLYRQVNLHDWILKKFSDKDCDAASNDVIYLKKQSWNNLMNFAISVSLMEQNTNALTGSNGLIFYADENYSNFLPRIENTLKKKPLKQIFPVAVITAKNDSIDLLKLLENLKIHNHISSYKIYTIDQSNTLSSVDRCTKSALKWLAKNIPNVPSLEMDTLESVLHQCVGMEFWYRLKLERHTRMDSIYKDLNKLVELYNIALDELVKILTDKCVRENSSFAPELKRFIYNDSLFPKTYEFFPDDWTDSKHTEVINDIFKSLKLQQPKFLLYATRSTDLINQVKKFCDEIEWFENPNQVSCQIISHLPKELSTEDINERDFSKYLDQYDFLDMISVAVVEKLKNTPELRNKYVIYEKATLIDFKRSHWWYKTEMVSTIKHKALEFVDDEIDNSLNESLASNAKRFKYDESDELLALEEKDENTVEESINLWDKEIMNLNSFNVTAKELEKQLEEEAVKASNLEELLRAALLDE